MAKATTYNTSGNKEDLTSIISVLEPEATPFVSLMKKGKATGTFFEMQVDRLNSPEFGGVSEGEDVTSFTNQSAESGYLPEATSFINSNAEADDSPKDV